MSQSEAESETQSAGVKQSWCDEHLEWICGYANACGEALNIDCKLAKGRTGH